MTAHFMTVVGGSFVVGLLWISKASRRHPRKSVTQPVADQRITAASVAAQLDGQLPVETVDLVIWHIEQKTGKHRTIEVVWGAKKGGSKKFKTARSYYEQIEKVCQSKAVIVPSGQGV